jgi:phage recombination protein Bet
MAETKQEPVAEKAVVSAADKPMEYIPFGGKDSIKLSVAIIKKFISVPTKNGHNCSDVDAMRFMMMCSAKRLNPFEQDAFLIGYDSKDGPKFSLITAHQAFLKRAETNPEYDGMESGVIVKTKDGFEEIPGDFHDEKAVVVGGWAKVYFKNRSRPMYKRLRLQRFQKAFGVWQDDPAGMICKCAEADALRSSFPTMIGGLYLREEIERDMGVTSEKVVAPLFKEARKSEPSFVEAEEVAPQTPVDQLVAMSAKSNIPPLELVAFCVEIGVINKDQHLADVPLEMVEKFITQWDDIASRIIAGRKAQ